MKDELKRLHDDLKVIERYEGRMYALAAAKAEIGNKIAALEAEAADPWREAIDFASAYRDPKGSSNLQKLIAHYDHLSAENERLTKRVAELEKDPEFTPSILKRADEIVVGDVILAGNRIQTVTEIDSSQLSSQRIIKCDGWMAWFYNGDLVAMLPQPLVEAKTVADMQPPSETAWVESEIAKLVEADSDEPGPLDPARVLLTAVGILATEKHFRGSVAISDAMFCLGISADKPYRLKGTDE